MTRLTPPTVDPTAVDEQGLVAIIECHPLDSTLVEIELGKSLGDPVEQLESVLVLVIHWSVLLVGEGNQVDSGVEVGRCQATARPLSGIPQDTR